MSVKDKIIIGMILFFTTVAFTLELYWLIHHNVMESRSDVFAEVLSIFWPADRTYVSRRRLCDRKSIHPSLEGVNTLLTPILSAIRVFAMITRARYRYALQLLVATYKTRVSLLTSPATLCSPITAPATICCSI